MGNPIFWWACLPSIAWVVARLVRRRRTEDLTIVLGFGCAWLPWAFVHRVTFIMYFLPAIPFGAMAVATVLEDLARAWPRAGAIVRASFPVVCMAVALNFYPIWTGQFVSRSQLEGRRWFWFDAWRTPRSS